MNNFADIERNSLDILNKWLEDCTPRGTIARNTIAIGIVVLDHLRRKCPLTEEEVLSNAGAEIKNARSGLGVVLVTYGVPATYLKEATTRQATHYGLRLFKALEWGHTFEPLDDKQRDLVLREMIQVLTSKAHEWLQRQNLKLDIERRHSPKSWISLILENATGRSAGIVEQHLVGAKLERRFPDREIPNFPAHAADKQTAREGDFTVATTVYHVTATPGEAVIEKCAANIRVGKQPVLLVPKAREKTAEVLAELHNIQNELTIIAIEDFVAINILELADFEGKNCFEVLHEIVEIYNRRLEAVETDLSLQIEVRWQILRLS